MTAERLPTCIGCDAQIGEMRGRAYLSPPGVVVLTDNFETFYICPACARDATRRSFAMTRFDWNRQSFWGGELTTLGPRR